MPFGVDVRANFQLQSRTGRPGGSVRNDRRFAFLLHSHPLIPIPLVKSNQNTWAVNSHDGSWRAGSTAGGCRNYLRSFANNPQYRIKLTDRDPDDDDDLCTVIVAVMQKYRRELKKTGVENLAIGFALYEVLESCFPLVHSSSFRRTR